MNVYEALTKVNEAKSNLIEELMILMPKSPTDEDYKKVAELQEAVTKANENLIAATKTVSEKPKQPAATPVTDKDNEVLVAMYACMQAKDDVINQMSATGTFALATIGVLEKALAKERAACTNYNAIMAKKKGAANG